VRFLVLTPGLALFFSQLVRSSVGVIEPELERAFGLSATQVGVLTGASFLAMAVLQVPMGLAVDRWGARPLLVFAVLVGALGTALFAWAPSFPWLVVARGVIGVGGAPVFAAAIALIATNVPQAAFSRFVGEESALGRMGPLFATAPFAWLAAALGWQHAFVVLAAVMAVVGLGAMLALRVERSGATPSPETLAQVRAGLRATCRAPALGPLILLQGAMVGVTTTLLSAWGAPWLRATYGWSLVDARNALTVLGLGYVGGALLWGAVSGWTTRHHAATLAGSAVMLGLLAAAASVPLTEAALLAWLAAAGFTSGSYPIVLAQLKSALPPHLVVRATSVLGLGTMTVSALLLVASGAVVDLHGDMPGHRSAAAFPGIFVLLGAVLAVAMIWYAVDGARRRLHGARNPAAR
jgi:MFS family permease